MQHVFSRRSDGFTLIEVLVVMAIAAILASIAWPSYTEHVVRAKRAGARAVLLEGAQYMERQYVHSNSYGSVTLPARLQTSPPDAGSGAAHYTVSVSASTTYAYTLTAAPVASEPTCATLTLAHTGARQKAGSRSLEECWR